MSLMDRVAAAAWKRWGRGRIRRWTRGSSGWRCCGHAAGWTPRRATSATSRTGRRRGSRRAGGEIESLTRRIAEAEAETARLQAAIDKMSAERRGAPPPPAATGPTHDGPAATDAASPPPDTPEPPTA